MKYSKIIAVIAVCLLVNACKDEEQQATNNTVNNENNNNSNQEVKIESAVDKLSYSIGFNFGRDLKENGLADVNIKLFTLGMQDVIDDKKAKVTEEQAIEASSEVQTRYAKQKEQEKEANLKAGQNFLAENGKREGVITTASGLQYEVLKAAENHDLSHLSTNEIKKAKKDDVVKVHYHGTLIDGKVFDSSVERGEPVEFPLYGVIEGWQEGLQLMAAGDKFKFFIPSNLAYGEDGSSGYIPANATLIFEVELLEIKDPAASSIKTEENDVQ